MKLNPIDAVFSAWRNNSIRNANPRGAKAVQREHDDVPSLDMIWPEQKPVYVPGVVIRRKAVKA
jgi:hypothetical protein